MGRLQMRVATSDCEDVRNQASTVIYGCRSAGNVNAALVVWIFLVLLITSVVSASPQD